MQDPNESQAALTENFNEIDAIARVSQRLQPLCCALLATREYNGPNRHKLMVDAYSLMQAIDIAARQIVLGATTQPPVPDSGSKIITP